MLPAVLTLMGLGLLFGAGLAFASRVLAVKRDERVEAIEEVLPGANCGACGFAGCSALSEALVEGEADVQTCPVSDSETLARVAQILGEETALDIPREVAKVRCRGTHDAAETRFSYAGIRDCAAAAETAGGHKVCEAGCLGMGSCVETCPFDCMYMKDGIPVVIEEECTGCGNCVEACPRDIIELASEDQPVFLYCVSTAGPREARDACSNACIGCGLCARTCEYDAITMKDNLPVFDFEKCTACGACVRVCPTDALGQPPATKEEAGS